MKKNFLIATIILHFLINIIVGQQLKSSKINFLPDKPKWNEKLTVTYIPGFESLLADTNCIVMYALFLPVNPTDIDVFENGKMNEINMHKVGTNWISEITPDSNVGCILFQFGLGDKVDNNNNIGWDLILYSHENKPVKGAYSALSQSYFSRFISSLLELERTNPDTALVYYQKEMLLYPENWIAQMVSFDLHVGEAKKKKDENLVKNIEAELDKLVDEHPNKVKLLDKIHLYYNKTNPTKSTEAVEQLEKIDPIHDRVLRNKLLDIGKIENVSERLKNLKSMEEKLWSNDFYSWYTYYYFESEVLAQLEEWKFLEELSYKTLTKMETDDLDFSVYTKKKKNELQDYYKLSPLNYIAVANYKLGNLDKASEFYKQVYLLKLNPQQRFKFLEEYLQFLIDTNQLDLAINIGQQAIENSEDSDKIIELFKSAYKKKTGNEKLAEDVITNAKRQTESSHKEELRKSILNDLKPAPVFKLKNLNGEYVSLANYRGKIVILDFWATWCSPCKAAFPFLQKFWDEHKQDSSIVVLAVNGWENEEGDKRIVTVNKFINDNGYTFPVVLDDSDNDTMSRYEISGVPTKYFIGPDGNIYFKEIGFNGPNMAEEMKIIAELIWEKFNKD